MTNSEAERIVLLNAQEDYALLWQIFDEVHASAPGQPPEDALRAARDAVIALEARGQLEVYRRNSRRDPFVRLDAAAAAAALKTDAYWRGDDTDTVEIAVAATPS